MSDNYIVINGKKSELTEEQLKLLGITARNNPFERVDNGDDYYYVKSYGDVWCTDDSACSEDNYRYDAVNYFNDRQFATQVALHQLLYRKLLKFAYDNGFDDTAEWNGMSKPTYDNTCDNTAEWSRKNQHYSVRYSYEDGDFVVYCQYDYKGQNVYFSSEEAVKRAIKEVVKPFMKEHPEFVW